MKDIRKYLIFSTCIMATSGYTLKSHTALGILETTLEKLNSFKRISYTYSYEHKYYSRDDSLRDKASIYYDFSRRDSILNFSYQIENERLKMIFNGTELFVLHKKENTMDLYPRPGKNYFKATLFHSNSLMTIKNALPSFTSRKELSKLLNDTSINGKNYYQVLLIPKHKGIEPMGDFSNITIKRDLTYKLLIHMEDYLPYQLIQTFSDNNDFQKTTFEDIKSPPVIQDNLWFYSEYTDKFKINLPKEYALIAKGLDAPEWTLPDAIQDGKMRSLQDYENKVVVVYFWIKNCGYCIASVPKLRELLKKYSSKGLNVVGINSYDSKETVKKFIDKYRPSFFKLYFW